MGATQIDSRLIEGLGVLPDQVHRCLRKMRQITHFKCL
jgi:hypothetical protein